ncbi:hypothetical protein V6N11_079511 [Hibiscus sabdariffa]|uniref:Uncharacterized protein n=1 Tax=Hibiscus sabdariffa TaxID=183260 RepID=A0ABR2RVQ1_9ROSI
MQRAVALCLTKKTLQRKTKHKRLLVQDLVEREPRLQRSSSKPRSRPRTHFDIQADPTRIGETIGKISLKTEVETSACHRPQRQGKNPDKVSTFATTPLSTTESLEDR